MEDTSTQISINDLAVLKSLIEISCTRGAFRAEEMRTAGEIYDKLTAFLDAVLSQAQAEMAAQANQQGESND